jgi:predicted Zn-dependent peptidase
MQEYTHKVETLGNGLRLLWLELPHVHGTCLGAFVRTGPAYESAGNNGVSHLLEHLHLSVTRRHPTRSGMRHALDELHGTVHAETHPTMIAFRFALPPDHLVQGANLIAEVLETRRFPDDIIDSEKRLVINEVSAARDRYDLSYYRELFGDHALARPRAGTPRSVSRLTSDDIAAFDEMSFAPDRIVVAMAGRIPGTGLNAVRSSLAALQAVGEARLSEPTPPQPRLPLIHQKRARHRLRRVFLGFVVTEALPAGDRTALNLLVSGLQGPGSPPSEKLRYVTGSTYEHHFSYSNLAGTRIFSLYGVTDKGDRDAFIRQGLQEFANIRSGNVSAAWFTNMKQRWRHWVEQAFDSPWHVAYRLGREEAAVSPAAPITIAEELQLIGGLSVDDAAETTRRLFTRDNLFLFFDSPRTRLLETRRVKRLVEECF